MTTETKTKLRTFVLIDPKAKTISRGRHESLNDAMQAAGLPKGEIDFGSVATNHSIVVYEYGLFVKPEDQHYFAIGASLYAGNAVIFCERDGETVDIEDPFLAVLREEIQWFNSSNDVMKAIKDEKVIQPSLSVNGEVLWVWPQPRPDL